MPNPYLETAGKVEKKPQPVSRLRLLMNKETNPLSDEFITCVLNTQEELLYFKMLEKDLKEAKSCIKKVRNGDGTIQIGDVGVVTTKTITVNRLSEDLLMKALDTNDLTDYKAPSEEQRVTIKPVETEVD